MVVPQDDSIPDFKDVIRFEPRELTKYFEVGWGGRVWSGQWMGAHHARWLITVPC